MILLQAMLHTPWVVGQQFLIRSGAVLALLLLAGNLPAPASDQTATFQIPPVKVPLNVKDRQVTITASAIIGVVRKERGLNLVKLELSADLSDLQRNLTGVLSSALDKNDGCGDHIAIQHASLAPQEPAGQAVVQLHYERWACAKVFGKKEARRLTGGDAVIEMKLTPVVGRDNTELRLVPDVGPIQADGSLGELLRSGTMGEMLRDKIRNEILSALQKGTNLSATLPAAIQGYARIQNAQFKDGGSGRLSLVLNGEFRITDEQIQSLSQQVRERVASR
jgi:hypothetical protein